jgi:hypothetical protein
MLNSRTCSRLDRGQRKPDGSASRTYDPAMPILAQFTDQVTECKSPGAVLDRLNDLIALYLPLSVLGAARIPLKLSDWRSVRWAGRLPALISSRRVVGRVLRYG